MATDSQTGSSRSESSPFQTAIDQAAAGTDLSIDQTSQLIDAMLRGEADEDLVGQLLLALKEKGEALGGDKIMEAAIEKDPEMKAKFDGFQKKMMGTMTKLMTTSPEAAKFISEKLASIMGK